MKRAAIVLAASLTLAGCYHATIDIPPTPAAGVQQQSSTAGLTIDVPWAHGFLYGLVPPSPVDAKAKCTNGVARVETQVSVVNQVANILTGGLYSPMHIKVTCR